MQYLKGVAEKLISRSLARQSKGKKFGHQGSTKSHQRVRRQLTVGSFLRPFSLKKFISGSWLVPKSFSYTFIRVMSARPWCRPFQRPLCSCLHLPRSILSSYRLAACTRREKNTLSPSHQKSRRQYWATHSSVCLHCSLICLLRPPRYVSVLRCVHSFVHSLTPSLMEKSMIR